MLDSKRTRRRIMDFIVSQRNRVASGRNKNVFRWIFENIAKGDYSHERVTALRSTIDAMETDGELVQVRAENGKVIAIELPQSKMSLATASS